MFTRNTQRPALAGDARADENAKRRHEAVRLALDAGQRPRVPVPDNGDNTAYETAPMAFTKGLAHDDFGMVARADYDRFVAALTQAGPDSAYPDRDFDVPNVKFDEDNPSLCGATGYRRWESPLAGVYFDLQGPDSDAVAMAPAPRYGESELCAEIVEVYAMALVRDLTFEQLSDPTTRLPCDDGATVQDLVDALNGLSWNGAKPPVSSLGSNVLSTGLTKHERGRRRPKVTAQSLFRGSTEGANSGKNYISEFMTLGTPNREAHCIAFGTNTISQKVVHAAKGIDYMTSWGEWLDVQRGADLTGRDTLIGEDSEAERKLVETPRDLATYVHFDQLYQAYFNACLLLLGNGKDVNFDPGFPDMKGHPTRGAFATFGGPHILSLMTEVASRALRAVRRQKFQIHRRARPERLAALLTLAANGEVDKLGSAKGRTESMMRELGIGGNPATAVTPILNWIAKHNKEQNATATRKKRGIVCDPVPNGPTIDKHDNYLLPMAFPEGSPMHPAYGAGHATVAGACVTILKAFFDVTGLDGKGGPAEKPTMAQIGGSDALTIEGELDKLAANIAIGRNFAGVHFYTDYYDSLRMGERVAVGMLQEQMLAYNEAVSMTLTSFDGDLIRIATDGGSHANSVTVTIRNSDDDPVPMASWWRRHTAEFEVAGLDTETSDLLIATARRSNWAAA